MLVAGPNGQGVVSTPGVAVRADRGAVPAGRRDRHRVAVGQLHLVVHELRGADGRRREPRGVGRQRGRGHHPRLPRASTRRIPPPSVALAYVEGVPDGRGVLRAGASGGGRQAAGARQGRGHGRRPAGGGEPHRFAGQRRPRLRRHVPSGRHHPRRHDRGGVRGRRHLRHPAAPEGQPRGGDDDGRRLGRGHRRRHQPLVARARPAARRPARRPRREAPAALEPRQPGRPRRRRDPRHHPRGARPDHRPPRRRRRGLPRASASSRTRPP